MAMVRSWDEMSVDEICSDERWTDGLMFKLCVLEGDLREVPTPKAAPSAGWDCRRMDGALWALLPREILENRILMMLPVASKCRFRAVCKEWRRLLSSSQAFLTASPSMICSLEMRPAEEENKDADESVYWDRVSRLKLWELLESCRPLAQLDVPCVDMQDGLICVVDARAVMSPQSTNIWVVNPMNNSHRLLPKCGATFPNLERWKVKVLVDRFPGSGFRVLLMGRCRLQGLFRGRRLPITLESALCRVLSYSSQTDRWELFSAERLEEGCILACDWVVQDGVLYSFCDRMDTINLYTLEEGTVKCIARVALVQDTVNLTCPSRRVVGLVAHLDDIYVVRGFSGYASAQGVVGIWQLDKSELKWKHISSAPEALVEGSGGNGDDCEVSYMMFSSMGDYILLEFSVVCQTATGYWSRKWFAYHIPDQSWHDISTFCTKDRVELDAHSLFVPRFDLFV